MTGISSELRPEVRPEVRGKIEKSSFFIRKLFEHTKNKRVGFARTGIHGHIQTMVARTGPDKLDAPDFLGPNT